VSRCCMLIDARCSWSTVLKWLHRWETEEKILLPYFCNPQMWPVALVWCDTLRQLHHETWSPSSDSDSCTTRHEAPLQTQTAAPRDMNPPFRLRQLHPETWSPLTDWDKLNHETWSLPSDSDSSTTRHEAPLQTQTAAPRDMKPPYGLRQLHHETWSPLTDSGSCTTRHEAPLQTQTPLPRDMKPPYRLRQLHHEAWTPLQSQTAAPRDMNPLTVSDSCTTRHETPRSVGSNIRTVTEVAM